MSDEAASKTRSRALRLAARFKRAVQRDEALERAEAAERARFAGQTEAALARLFDDLVALGRAAGVGEVTRRGRDFRLAWHGRSIRIASSPTPDAPDCLVVEATGVEAALGGALRPEIDRWVLHISHPPVDGRPGTQRSLLLLDEGLEWLLEKAFGLSMAEDEDPLDPRGARERAT